MFRIMSIDWNILFPVFKIRLKATMGYTSNTIVFQFTQHNLKLWGHEWIFHQFATNFSNCCNFMNKFWVTPGIFFCCATFFLKTFVSATTKNLKSIWIFFLLLKQILWEKREFVKKLNKKHVSPHLQHELMQHNSV